MTGTDGTPRCPAVVAKTDDHVGQTALLQAPCPACIALPAGPRDPNLQANAIPFPRDDDFWRERRGCRQTHTRAHGAWWCLGEAHRPREHDQERGAATHRTPLSLSR